MGPSGTKRLAVLAGAGRLPRIVSKSAMKMGYKVEAFGFNSMLDKELIENVEKVHQVPFCNIGYLFAKIEESGITEAVTIGSIAQTRVMSGIPQFDDAALEIWKNLPDRRVDTIMLELVKKLEEIGVNVLNTTDFLQDHLAPAGPITKKVPTAKELEDVKFGFRMAKAIGGIDIGQTVVVKHRAVMAVEAVEGTDEAIKRGAELAKGGAVVVKVAKPDQDLRFDVPAVGMETLETMHSSGSSVLGLEAGNVLIVEKDPLTVWADKMGIAIVGMTEEEACENGK